MYVINTCSVTNIADRKSRQMPHRAKKMNPDAVVVAAGCYVQAAGEEPKKDAAIDVIIGNNRKKDLVPLLDEYFRRKNMEEDSLIDIGKTREYGALHINKIADHTRAFIKIQDGQNLSSTSYCIIPYTRGRVRSRKAGRDHGRNQRPGGQGLLGSGADWNPFKLLWAGSGRDHPVGS